MRSRSRTIVQVITTSAIAMLSLPNSAHAQPGHLENPFVGASFYRNVDYVAAVNAAADRRGGAPGEQMREVANYPTFVWLDSIAAVHGAEGYSRSLAGHLDKALEQGANA